MRFNYHAHRRSQIVLDGLQHRLSPRQENPLDFAARSEETSTSEPHGRTRIDQRGYSMEKRKSYNDPINAVSKLAAQIVGSRRAYHMLDKPERLRLREIATAMYESGMSIDTAKRAQVTDKRGFVYVITHPAFSDYVKVGRAFDPDARLRGYQTGCPLRRYKLYDQTYFEDCHFAEREIHERLSHCRAEGEWFHITPLLAQHTINQLRSII
jgi:hypothetical protein